MPAFHLCTINAFLTFHSNFRFSKKFKLFFRKNLNCFKKFGCFLSTEMKISIDDCRFIFVFFSSKIIVLACMNANGKISLFLGSYAKKNMLFGFETRRQFLLRTHFFKSTTYIQNQSKKVRQKMRIAQRLIIDTFISKPFLCWK